MNRNGRLAHRSSLINRRLGLIVSLLIALGAALPIPAIAAAANPSNQLHTAADDDDSELPRMQLVLDSSGSMDEPAGGGKKRIDAAKEALDKVVDSLPDDQEVGMRVFGLDPDVGEDTPEACKDTESVVDVGTDNRDDLRSAIDDYEPAGWTPTGYALQQAAKDLGSGGKRSIVLISDGESNCKPEPCEAAKELSGQGIDLRIDVVGLNVSGKARDQLSCIAKEAGGSYVDAKDAAGIVRGVTETVVRASRPFDLTGTAIKGATTVDAGPQIKTGQYLDKVPQTGTLYYRLKRTVPGSTVNVGVIFESNPDQAFSLLNVRTYVRDAEDSTDGLADCGDASAFREKLNGERQPRAYTATTSWQEDPQDPCVTADEIIVGLENRGSGGGSAGLPMEIAVYEEPPPADKTGRDLDPAPDVPTWTELSPEAPTDGEVPGSSIANAPVVEDGTYSLNINMGESQVLAVPMDWGQNLQALLEANPSKELIEEAGTTAQIVVDVIGPVRADPEVELSGDERPENWSTLNWIGSNDSNTFRTGSLTNTIGYLNRSTSETAGASVPGLHYVRVRFAGTSDSTPNLGYTLTLKRNGEAGTGKPQYASTDKLPEPEATSRLTVSADDEQEGGKDESKAVDSTKGLPWLPIGLAVAGVLGILAAAALLIRSRRRRSRA